MSSARCPYCNYRIFSPSTLEACPNCGQLLPETPLLSSGASVGAAHRPALPGPPDPSINAQSFGIAGGIPPGPDTATDPEIVVVAPPVDSAAPARKKKSWRGPRFTSSLRGVVLSVQTQHESQSQDAPDIIGGIFRAIRDIVWPVMETSQQQRDDRIVITQIRLRLVDGAQRDARLEGRLVGANISLGDEITLWGRYRKGTLLVQRGYNHTSEARILRRHASSSGSLIFILGLAVLVVALYVLTSGFHRFVLWP